MGEEPELGIDREDGADGPVIRYTGALAMDDGERIWNATRRLADGAPSVSLDLSGAKRADGGAIALLVGLRNELRSKGIEAEITGGDEEIRDLLALVEHDAREPLRGGPSREGLLTRIGGQVEEGLTGIRESLSFLGDLVVALGRAVVRPRSVNWRDLWAHMERTGADGLPIIALLNFLVGLSLAFQSATLLKRYGANIFVADLVALSIVRELGPLVTAIVATGRSGAAFAAELGTMKVSEEIDAVRTLGLCPYRYFVFPRVLALALMLPLLTILGVILGVLGGLLMGVTVLELTPTAYLLQTQRALSSAHVLSGIGKSMAFGIVIGLLGCQRGLATRAGAAGVGRSTTSAVVATLFVLIVVDTVFNYLYMAFGI